MSSSLSGSMSRKSTAASTTPAQAEATINENKYLQQPEQGLQLFAQLIANTGNETKQQTETNKVISQIKQTIEVDFLNLAKRDNNTQCATTYVKLQQLIQQLGEIAAFPHLEKYYTIAVGGSFSAGKSRFLNSVLGCPSLLPTDTTPTTSIPTYISQGNKNTIKALNFYRKKTAIDEQALKAICHAFYEKFAVTFSHLLQLISVERQDFIYPSLVFLDTPGYSKADNIGESAGNQTDANIAKEHLSRADYLIWLVDQQNGTIPQQDIEFINALSLDQPVLVVISKADKKIASEIEKIVAATKSSLERAGINYLDVIAYSARKNEEYSASKNVLTSLMQQISQGKTGSTVLWQLNEIFNHYIHSYQSEQQSLKLTNGTLNELVFDETLPNDKKSHLSNLQQKTKDALTSLKEQQHTAEKIHQELSEQIKKLCQLVNVTISNKPNAVDLKSLRKKQQSKNTNKETAPQQYSFNALIQGDEKQLANHADLTAINGKVSKVSAVGVWVDINNDFDILIMKQRIKEQLGDINISQHFILGKAVSVQFVDNKNVKVKVELAL